MTSNADRYTPIEWLQPLSEQAPCGPSLEYDPDYAMLVSRLQPRGDVQYGDFIDASQTPDWSDIERLCRGLLGRTRDINVLVWLCRARVRSASALGLAQGLEILADVLERWPQDVHPQAHIDGEPDPAVRANALAALCDLEGLLGDVREIAVSANAVRLLVRDVERAFSVTRGGDTAEAVAVRQQLDDLWLRARGDSGAAIRLHGQAACSAQRIQRWCTQQLEGDAPDLLPLLRVLRPYEAQADPLAKPAQHDAGALATPLPSTAHDPPGSFAGQTSWPVGDDPAQMRASVLQNMRAARQWFEAHEPSSPVAVLLKQAERMVGQRFSMVADVIPLDLLRQWDSPLDEPASQR